MKLAAVRRKEDYMKKRLLLALISIVMIFTVVFFIACDGESETFNENIDLEHDDLRVAPNESAQQGIDKPDASRLTALSSSLSEDVAVKESATYLFNLANDNLSKVSYYANYAYGSGVATVVSLDMSGSMQVREVRIKDGAAMYMVTLGRVMNGYKTATPEINDSHILGLCRSLLDYGNRKYTPDGQTFYLQNGKSSCLLENSVDNFYTDTPYIDWNKCKKVKSMSLADFMKEDYYNKSYVETTNGVIIPENIVNASISHNDDGYYEIEITVDITTDALKLSTESTRNSASSDDIVYRYQTIKCQIWDCGLFRQYETYDSWAGTLLKGLLEGYSTNEWHKLFTYNKENAPLYQIPSDVSWAK